MSLLKEVASRAKDFSVLYVEDDRQLREDTVKLLSTLFKSVETAANGEEAFEKFNKSKPDIIITDLRMPKMSGFELSKNIREIKPSQPIIILSAHDEEEYRNSLIDIGVEAITNKPLEIITFASVLLDTIEKMG